MPRVVCIVQNSENKHLRKKIEHVQWNRGRKSNCLLCVIWVNQCALKYVLARANLTIKVLQTTKGDMMKALDHLLMLKQGAMNSNNTVGKAAEKEEEAQLRAFQRERTTEVCCCWRVFA